MKIHHVGYMVKKMQPAIEQFRALGYEIEQDTVFDDYRKIDICFMTNGAYRIELVSPKSEDSVVWNLRKKTGNAPYHICYETPDLERAAEELRGQGYVAWDEPHEAVAIGGRRVVFLVNGRIGMIELVETP